MFSFSAPERQRNPFEYQKEIDELKKAYADLNRKYLTLQGENTTLKAKIENCESTIQQKDLLMRIAEKKKEQEVQTRMKVETDCKDLERTVSAQVEINQTLRNDIVHKNTEIAALQRKIEEDKPIVDSVKGGKGDSQQVIEGMRARLQELDQTLVATRRKTGEEITTLKSENARVKSELRGVKDKFEALQRKTGAGGDTDETYSKLDRLWRNFNDLVLKYQRDMQMRFAKNDPIIQIRESVRKFLQQGDDMPDDDGGQAARGGGRRDDDDDDDEDDDEYRPGAGEADSSDSNQEDDAEEEESDLDYGGASSKKKKRKKVAKPSKKKAAKRKPAKTARKTRSRTAAEPAQPTTEQPPAPPAAAAPPDPSSAPEPMDDSAEPPIKRGRGRPRKSNKDVDLKVRVVRLVRLVGVLKATLGVMVVREKSLVFCIAVYGAASTGKLDSLLREMTGSGVEDLKPILSTAISTVQFVMTSSCPYGAVTDVTKLLDTMKVDIPTEESMDQLLGGDAGAPHQEAAAAEEAEEAPDHGGTDGMMADGGGPSPGDGMPTAFAVPIDRLDEREVRDAASIHINHEGEFSATLNRGSRVSHSLVGSAFLNSFLGVPFQATPASGGVSGSNSDLLSQIVSGSMAASSRVTASFPASALPSTATGSGQPVNVIVNTGLGATNMTGATIRIVPADTSMGPPAARPAGSISSAGAPGSTTAPPLPPPPPPT